MIFGKQCQHKKFFTLFNFKLDNNNGIDGYNWNDEINMSFQSKDANGTLKEIINMLNINNYSIKIKIKLKNEKSKRTSLF